MTSPRIIKFLLVDDLDANLLALEGLLKRDGLELLKARSGSEALELLLVHDFALALIDVQMPGMSGFELAELMRGTERTRSVPIIFLTAGVVDQQRRILLSQPGQHPSGLLLAHGDRRTHQHQGGHLDQPGGHAQPVLPRLGHHDATTEVDPEGQGRVETELRHPDHGRPLPGLGRTGHQRHGQTRAVQAADRPRVQADEIGQTGQQRQLPGDRGPLHPVDPLTQVGDGGSGSHLSIFELLFEYVKWMSHAREGSGAPAARTPEPPAG